MVAMGGVFVVLIPGKWCTKSLCVHEDETEASGERQVTSAVSNLRNDVLIHLRSNAGSRIQSLNSSSASELKEW